ncbi:MAG: UDP-3-O-acyl-N-acetylglucosamine deacetylase, partial [Streptosporangiaceae bacterium]
ILDGSALPYMAMLDAARPRRQQRKRRVLRVVEKLELREGEKFIGIYPAASYQLRYRINFPHPMIGRQEFALELTPESYRRELAPARTFGFLSDFAAMRRQGLIRGGSLENAVVLDEQRVVNGELRFRDEFVRHKMLDLIGDLALLGGPLQAEVVADRAGHALHTALVQRLLANRRHWEWVEQTVAAPAAAEAALAAIPVYTD